MDGLGFFVMKIFLYLNYSYDKMLTACAEEGAWSLGGCLFRMSYCLVDGWQPRWVRPELACSGKGKSLEAGGIIAS